MNFAEIKKQFDAMSAAEQWEWLVKTDLKDKFTVMMDLDQTEIWWDDDHDADYGMYFKTDISITEGGEHLLTALGIKNERV